MFQLRFSALDGSMTKPISFHDDTVIVVTLYAPGVGYVNFYQNELRMSVQ